MKTLLGLILLTASFAQAALTTVTGTIKKADGSNYSGFLYLSWPSFTNAAGTFIPSGRRYPISVTAGALSVALESSTGRSFVYTVEYGLLYGATRTEFWVVPESGPVDVSVVRTTTIVSPLSTIALAQLGAGGAVLGDLLYFNGTYWAKLTPPTVSFTSATSVTFTHNLGRQYVNYECYVSGQRAEPATAVATSTTVLTITWDTAKTGTCSAL